MKRFLLFASALILSTGIHAAEPIVNGRPLSEIADARIETPANTYWAGEVFPLTLGVSVVPGYLSLVPPDFEWSASGLVIEDWSAPVRGNVRGRDGVTQTTRAYVRTGGPISLPPTTRTLSLVTGVNGDRSTNTEPFALPTTAPRLMVRPLPEPAPSTFGQAVGQFALVSTVTSLAIAVGESVTWTLELSGAGNWPEIGRMPGRVLSKDFRAVAPVVRRSSKPGVLFEGTLVEDVLLVATKAGDYQLGPVRFTYFDPRQGKYQMITTETFTLQVGGGSGKTNAAAGDSVLANVNRTPVPAAPPPLPMDPLDTRHDGPPPIAPRWVWLSLVVCALAVLACWLRLAIDHSHLTDPLYPKRQARGRLGLILEDLDRGGLPSDEVRRLLFAWQQAASELSGIKVSTPTPAEIAHALESTRRGTRGSSWALLWREANRALYGEQAVLPADWAMRAKAALSEVVLPGVPLRAAFRRKNLLAFAAALVVFGALPDQSRADEGAARYLAGDFAAAEKAWSEAVVAQPLDARPRYNLALVAAQQDRWTESAAHALAAFCLAPREPAIRWQFALSVERAGIDQAQITGLAHGTAFFGIARWLSPGEWGVAVIVAAFAAAGALAWVLHGRYYRRRGWRQAPSLAIAVLALGVVAAGVISLDRYGALADGEIAVVARNTLLASVPTEIDTTQKTVPLPAGSLGKVDRTFLGWSRLVFANDQTGWVRTDAVVRLYR